MENKYTISQVKDTFSPYFGFWQVSKNGKVLHTDAYKSFCVKYMKLCIKADKESEGKKWKD